MNPSISLVRPYLSASQLQGYLRCPKQYWFRYIAGKSPEHHSSALCFGRAWGTVIGRYLIDACSGQSPSIEALVEQFAAELRQELKDAPAPVLFDEDESEAVLIERASRMLEIFVAKVPLPDKLLGLEVAFSVPLVHPHADEELSVPLVGAIDALVEQAGRPVIWELKTAKKKYSPVHLECEMLQPVAYQVGARSLGVVDAPIEVIVTTKSAKPDVQISRLLRHETDEIELYDLAEAVIRASEYGVFPRNRSWTCKTCPYAGQCSP